MKKHVLPVLVFVASILAGWIIYRTGGNLWLLVYAVFGGPFLMAAAWALDQRGQRDA